MKKRIIIFFSILFFVISLIIIYIKTDLLKTKEQLFWKYFFIEKNQIMQVISNTQIQDYNNKIEKSYYIKEGNISIISKNKLINPINMKISEKGNNKEETTNTNITLKYNENHIGDISIIKDDNYILLKSDLINSNYIGFENENLKELAKKLGLKNTDLIPDKIEKVNYKELFSITDNKKNHILKKYIPICRDFINNKDYNKQKNVKLNKYNNDITTYQLNISQKDANELIIQLLNQLCQDEIALELISEKISIIDSKNSYCNIDKIKQKINETLKYFQEKEPKDEILFSIIIYQKEKNVIKTEIILKDERTISIETDNNNELIIKQYNVKEQQINLDNIEGIITTILNTITEITYSRNIINSTTNKVDINVICNIGLENITFNYNYVEQIKNNVENITYKDEVNYIDLKNATQEFYNDILEKVLKINTL